MKTKGDHTVLIVRTENRLCWVEWSRDRRRRATVWHHIGWLHGRYDIIFLCFIILFLFFSCYGLFCLIQKWFVT